MNLYLVITTAVLVGILIGIIIGRNSKDKPVGTLILNESDRTKEYFEFHFEEDIDTFKDNGRISFNLLKR